MASLDKGAGYIKQILPHGFESFELTCWQYIGSVDLAKTAKEVLDCLGNKAVVGAIGIFGNPLQDEQTRKDWERMIDAAPLFKTDLVCGFAGALENQSVDKSMARFKEVFTPLCQRAADRGVRIAFENCDMGGSWAAPKYNIAHSPTAWEMMFNEVPAANLGLEWEPCHQMVSLVDPIANLRQWAKKVFHVHGKDATIAWDVLKRTGLRGGQPWVWHRSPGFGDTNWTDVITILRQHDFKGAIDIEGWHDPIYKGDLEMTGQVHALNYLKRCRGGDYIPNPQ
jgi:sugar phosphate isomerase/epimerase